MSFRVSQECDHTALQEEVELRDQAVATILHDGIVVNPLLVSTCLSRDPGEICIVPLFLNCELPILGASSSPLNFTRRRGRPEPFFEVLRCSGVRGRAAREGQAKQDVVPVISGLAKITKRTVKRGCGDAPGVSMWIQSEDHGIQ